MNDTTTAFPLSESSDKGRPAASISAVGGAAPISASGLAATRIEARVRITVNLRISRAFCPHPFGLSRGVAATEGLGPRQETPRMRVEPPPRLFRRVGRRDAIHRIVDGLRHADPYLGIPRPMLIKL